MNKALMISIQPQHAVNILNGKKTLELRTWIPKGYVGWVYVYVSKANKNNGGYLLKQYYTNGDFEKYITSLSLDEDLAPFSILNGKVVFCFWFDEYETYDFDNHGVHLYTDVEEYNVMYDDLERLCLDYREIETYGKGKTLYAWHIKKLEVFDEPKQLSEFYTQKHFEINNFTTKNVEGFDDWLRLKKAPQKFCYCYVVDKE